MHATASAGHVVVLSGVTLFFTFALLTAFPQGFLSSVGFGCGKSLFFSLLTPSFMSLISVFVFTCCPSQVQSS